MISLGHRLQLFGGLLCSPTPCANIASRQKADWADWDMVVWIIVALLHARVYDRPEFSPCPVFSHTLKPEPFLDAPESVLKHSRASQDFLWAYAETLGVLGAPRTPCSESTAPLHEFAPG